MHFFKKFIFSFCYLFALSIYARTTQPDHPLSDIQYDVDEIRDETLAERGRVK